MIYFSYKNWCGLNPQLCGLALGGSPWTSGDHSAWFCGRVAEMVLRLTGARREELGSKGEMRGTHSRGLWGADDARKGRSVVVVVTPHVMDSLITSLEP
jgi:hypothetical protein